MYNFDPYNVLLTIATNIPVLLMTAFVLQDHKYRSSIIHSRVSLCVCVCVCVELKHEWLRFTLSSWTLHILQSHMTTDRASDAQDSRGDAVCLDQSSFLIHTLSRSLHRLVVSLRCCAETAVCAGSSETQTHSSRAERGRMCVCVCVCDEEPRVSVHRALIVVLFVRKSGPSSSKGSFAYWWCQLKSDRDTLFRLEESFTAEMRAVIKILFYITVTIYVTLNHKTSHKGQFYEIEIYTSSESWINHLSIDVWFVMIGQYL